MKKNLIVLMIDGGRPDRANKSRIFDEIKKNQLI